VYAYMSILCFVCVFCLGGGVFLCSFLLQYFDTVGGSFDL